MGQFDNPAERLAYWLIKVNDMPHGRAALATWCAVFDLDPDVLEDRAECLRRCAAVMDLAVQVRVRADQLPREAHAGLMLTHFDEVETVVWRLTSVGSINVAELLQGLGGLGWQSMQLISAMLSTHLPEKTLEDDQTDDFVARAESLRDDLEADDSLSDDVKALIVSRLNDVIAGLEQIRLTGAPGIEKATDALITAVWRKCGGAWLKDSSSGKKIVALVAAIALALEMGANTKALLPGSEPPAAVTQEIEVDVDVNQTTVVVTPEDVDAGEGASGQDPADPH